MDLLYCFEKIGPYINDLTINSVSVTVADKEKYVAFYPAPGFPEIVHAGEHVPDGTVVKEAMVYDKKIVKQVSEKVFGIPYNASGMPIKENGEIIGAVSFLVTTDKQKKLAEITGKLNEDIISTNAANQLILEGSKRLEQVYTQLLKLSERLHSYINETDEVLKMIEDFARQTNLLGLNASVEAARVGNIGRGFGIIAAETRKLAAEITNSTKRIEEIFVRIKGSSGHQAEMISRINEIISNQSSQIALVTEYLGSLEGAVHLLTEHAKQMMA